ncbi:MAG: 23S rRNA (adenine(2503)-C(2))-methyltransferase RlmN [Rhodospirillaceae bacterium]|jgi:23S rRNA (adenine2503-C2)-methyltransferase|nr:23S rRNA (adenine(2503)-C(2))-methyltransferase RlmN [Rhodospirillaceae bacterium]MBT3628372.1 23S rRNA (adenine(2503)-C(2))-methyltransferase RlmN [Rhodospirillaceae bacterium]MBT4425554.1 23S rRNA (adenine(2503)-C(2))-methyltransferase RlmN [Rhodospirillaceae bacterium]MBT5040465.1 23S rRNA (adenine(2503)-C(2))-methyltransferase RlmN [Rhodospirillaceae bacterium]MBT5677520.1 23S rRNA (adenine(2503)-C(2))-methyltransferase RlmN [Rhodospirillaceae bacterium]
MNETSTSPAHERTNLIGMDRAELACQLVAMGEPEKGAKLRAKQLWHWIYHHGVADFSEMTTLNGPLRETLAERFTLARPDVAREQRSEDGTRKWLLRFEDGQEAESVFIPEEDRGALCLSSQVGCTLTCKFCHTGTQRLVRNLGAREIVSQFLVARDSYDEWPTPQDGRMISNIVMMGMGEPLFNYDNVAKAIQIAMDPEGFSISRRRITLSTAGVAPMIERCGAELGVNLAISLHAVEDDLRDEIMPINRKYPLAQLLEACRRYPRASNARRITFEYVMLKGVNDSPADAKALVQLIAGIPAKINLIPFNAWPGAPYECSSPEAIDQFAAIVNKAGYSAPVRAPRGRDILAACGQLRSESVKARRSGQPSKPRPAPAPQAAIS